MLTDADIQNQRAFDIYEFAVNGPDPLPEACHRLRPHLLMLMHAQAHKVV